MGSGSSDAARGGNPAAASSSEIPEPEELVSASEIAEILGIGRKAVNVYHSRGEMPEPYVVLACGPIWLRSEIERWADSRPRAKRVSSWAHYPEGRPLPNENYEPEEPYLA